MVFALDRFSRQHETVLRLELALCRGLRRECARECVCARAFVCVCVFEHGENVDGQEA